MSKKNAIKEIYINTFPVELNKLLKLENFVQSGGEAKTVILEGLILVNGEVETRIRKKIFEGDELVIDNQKYIVKQAD